MGLVTWYRRLHRAASGGGRDAAPARSYFPVVARNVSLYNETDGRGDPAHSPAIGGASAGSTTWAPAAPGSAWGRRRGADRPLSWSSAATGEQPRASLAVRGCRRREAGPAPRHPPAAVDTRGRERLPRRVRPLRPTRTASSRPLNDVSSRRARGGAPEMGARERTRSARLAIPRTRSRHALLRGPGGAYVLANQDSRRPFSRRP